MAVLKESTTPQNLFYPASIEFSRYMHYCMSLPFSAKPDYKYLKEFFLDIIANNQTQKDIEEKNVNNFDWMVKRAALIQDY